MLYFELNADLIVCAVHEDSKNVDRSKVTYRGEFKSYSRAQEIAFQASKATGKTYLPTDSGPCVSPRYDVIEVPQVGDKVSKAFNGDYYPDGESVKISDSFKRIVTSTGNVYYRRRLSGSWKLSKSCFSLVPGHISEWNPSF